MSFPRYPEYRESGIDWLGALPSHWLVIPLKAAFELQKRPPPDDSGVVTAFRDGQVTLRANRRTDGFTEAIKESGYQGIEPDDLVIHAMDAFAGAIGVSDSRGKSTPVYSVCKPKAGYVSRYYGLTLRHIALAGYVQSLAKGIRERSTDFRWSDAKNVPIPCPSKKEQENILQFLDHETAKTDALITEQEKLIALLKEKLFASALKAFKEGKSELKRLIHLVDVISRPVQQKSDELYEPLGLYNRGRGLFHKELRSMEEMGDSDFFWVETGDLIFSGQFAWEGAVALASDEESGCVVSHRYPIIRGKEGVAITEYLFALFTSSHGTHLLNECSIGAAGRNRPLNMNLLLKTEIPVPLLSVQGEVAEQVHKLNFLLRSVYGQHRLLQERRSALISAAVTGQIDVRDFA